MSPFASITTILPVDRSRTRSKYLLCPPTFYQTRSMNVKHECSPRIFSYVDAIADRFTRFNVELSRVYASTVDNSCERRDGDDRR